MRHSFARGDLCVIPPPRVIADSLRHSQRRITHASFIPAQGHARARTHDPPVTFRKSHSAYATVRLSTSQTGAPPPPRHAAQPALHAQSPQA